MSNDATPIERMSADVASALDALIEEFLARHGGDAESARRRNALKEYLWDNKIGLLRISQAYGPLVADLRETFKAVLHFWGPEGAENLTSDSLSAKWRQAGALSVC